MGAATALVTLLLAADDAAVLQQLKTYADGIAALAVQKKATSGALEGYPYWAVVAWRDDGTKAGRLVQYAMIGDGVVHLRLSEHMEDDGVGSRLRRPTIPIDALKRIITAPTTEPRIKSFALRYVSEAFEPNVLELVEKSVDDTRDAGDFAVLGHSEKDPLGWRHWTVGEVALGALNFMIGGLEQADEFTPFATAADYRVWRKAHPDVLRSIDFQRNRLELAEMAGPIYGEMNEAKDRLLALSKTDPALAALLAVARPTFSSYGLGEAWASTQLRAAFPGARLVRVVSGDEKLDALSTPANMRSLRWWLLQHPELLSGQGPKLLEAYQAHPDDLGLAIFTERAVPAQRAAILTAVLAPIDLRGDLSDSLYPWALHDLVLTGDPKADDLIARYFFDANNQNTSQVLEAVGEQEPAKGKRLLSALLKDERFAVHKKMLIDDAGQWMLMQSFLRAVVKVGCPVADFSGYVMDTQGASKYYATLGKKDDEPHHAARRKVVTAATACVAQ